MTIKYSRRAYDSTWVHNAKLFPKILGGGKREEEEGAWGTSSEGLLSVLSQLQSKYSWITCMLALVLNFYEALGHRVNDFAPLFSKCEGSTFQLAHDISTMSSKW